MFIRVTFGRVDPSRVDELTQWANAQLMPALSKLSGFTGYHGGIDAGSGLFVAVSRWETREQAESLREGAPEAFAHLDRIGVQLEPPQFFEETVTG